MYIQADHCQTLQEQKLTGHDKMDLFKVMRANIHSSEKANKCSLQFDLPGYTNLF